MKTKKRILLIIPFVLLLFGCSQNEQTRRKLMATAKSEKEFKIFISVDMEGIAGVVNWEDVRRDGKDYDYFRMIMTQETNAAIQAAFDAGATYVLVRDSHGSARNILPGELDSRAELLRDWDWKNNYKGMMEGIDSSFDAVMFIGYHAKAKTPNAILDHTMNSREVADISVNGISLPEAGINALTAGKFNVPVIFVAGDQAICDQVKELFGEVVTSATKKGIGNTSLGLHPDVVNERIRSGVEEAIWSLSKFKPFMIQPPYTLQIKYIKPESLNERMEIPGVEKTGEDEITFKSDDLKETITMIHKLF